MNSDGNGRDLIAASAPTPAIPGPGQRRSVVRRLRVAAIAVGVAASILLGGYGAASVVGADIATQATHTALTVNPSTIASRWKLVEFQSVVDHVPLRGTLFSPATPNGKSAVLCHGYRDSRYGDSFPRIARDLVAQGYTVLTFDFRADGKSGGDRTTLGNLESRDVRGAVDFLRQRGFALNRMALIGMSMGAEAAVGAATHLPTLGALVVDSMYANFSEEQSQVADKYVDLPSWAYWGVDTAERFFGVNPDLSPITEVSAMGRPLLIFQGEKDPLVPVHDAVEIARASHNPQTRLVVVPTAGHVGSIGTLGPRYLQILNSFLDQQIPGKAANGAAPSLN